MVKRLLIRLLFEHGGKILNSVLKAYKDVTKEMPKGGNNNTNNNNKQDPGSFADKFNLKNLMTTPITKDEALKILNLKPTEEITSKIIIERFEKIYEQNDPEKGGSFYLQNKAYFAKEFLMQDYPPEENKSKYDPEELKSKI
jgi:hypothetical protein